MSFRSCAFFKAALGLCLGLFATALKADPAMPPLCTGWAEVVAKHDEDVTLELRVTRVHGLLSALSCEGMPQQGDILRTSALWGADHRQISAGCTLSAGLSFEKDPLSGISSASGELVYWRNIAVECPAGKVLLQHNFSTRSGVEEARKL